MTDTLQTAEVGNKVNSIEKGILLESGVLRDVSEGDFDEAQTKWAPKLRKFANMYLPYIDYDDRLQEAKAVLYKCLQRFSADQGASFHTYFHQALFNRAGALAKRPVKHNEDPNRVIYLSEVFAEEDEGPSHIAEKMALSFVVPPTLQFEAEAWGFQGLEIFVVAHLADALIETDIVSRKEQQRERKNKTPEENQHLTEKSIKTKFTKIMTSASLVNLSQTFSIDLCDLEAAQERVTTKIAQLRGNDNNASTNRKQADCPALG